MRAPLPVIDLFAGPGGLGEGFARLRFGGRPQFRIALSIERDPPAHATLFLRTFFRQFPDGRAPEAYYEYVRGTIDRDELFARHPGEAATPERSGRIEVKEREEVAQERLECDADPLLGKQVLRQAATRLSLRQPVRPAGALPGPPAAHRRSTRTGSHWWPCR